MEGSAFPKNGSEKLTLTLRRPDQTIQYDYGYVVPGHFSYVLMYSTTEKSESPQFNGFVASFAVLSQSSAILTLRNVTWALILLTVFAIGIPVGIEFWKTRHQHRAVSAPTLPAPSPRISFSRRKPKTQIGIGLGMCLCSIGVATMDQIQGNSPQALGQLSSVVVGACIAHQGRRRLRQEQVAEISNSGPHIGPLDL